jgi:hypothetical protein
MHIPNFLKNKFENMRNIEIEFEIEFNAMIITSRGVISNFTIGNIGDILRSKQKATINPWTKRRVITALRESLNIWIKVISMTFDDMNSKHFHDNLEKKNNDSNDE